ncbi:MAG: glycosyltransferase [Deltaproteobacteria bacterium]|nr:glycosyltransferase [Deltaproteobacteria bacterium]
MNVPKVTVLMSVYNDERYVSQAIESILKQTFTDFEFLIINDGSTDSTSCILEQYAQKDNRIKVVHQENIGLTKSLNKGLKIAVGEYIARMDADDISLMHRLQRQVELLDEHSDIAVLGSWAQIIDEKGDVVSEYCPALSPVLLRWRLLFGNCLLHSTVMFRKDVIIRAGGYPEDCMIAQDYDLWAKLAFVAEIYQLSAVLIQYRQNKKAISFRLYDKQVETSIRVVQRNILEFFKMDVSMELAKALCDSENVRNFPVEKGALILEAVGLWLEFKKIFISSCYTSELSLKSAVRELKKDVANKVVALSRANAGFYPYQSIRALIIGFFVKPYIVSKFNFWSAIVKAILGQEKFETLKHWIRIMQSAIYKVKADVV